MTSQTKDIQKPILIWKGCDTRIARAIWEFQRACAAEPDKDRWRAIPALFRHHLDPALHRAIAAAGAKKDTLLEVFGSSGIAGGVSNPGVLDRDLCRFNKLTHGALTTTVDTLREAADWVENHRPARLVPKAFRGLKGELRRLNGAQQSRCWPFCEHCSQLSEYAEWQCRQDMKKLLHDASTQLSKRFCIRHKQKNGGSQRTVRRHSESFRQVLDALRRELSIDRAFLARFVQRAWEVDGKPPLKAHEVTRFLAENPDSSLIIDPVKSYVRKCASRIARELPNVTAVSIAMLHANGWHQSDIAELLELSRQAISQRLCQHRGFYDFTRHSSLLFWWPDDSLADPGMLLAANPSA